MVLNGELLSTGRAGESMTVDLLHIWLAKSKYMIEKHCFSLEKHSLLRKTQFIE